MTTKLLVLEPKMTLAARFMLLFVVTASAVTWPPSTTAGELVVVRLAQGRSVSGEHVATAPDGRVTLQFRGTVTRVVCSYQPHEIAGFRIVSPPSVTPPPTTGTRTFAELAHVALFGELPDSLPAAQIPPVTAEP